ncbi:caspase family protein [Shewanella sp.]|uniref:caspase family protein n=1 Tax=Shewanella sp. TaxID=50422 RepID=UPI00404708CB
MKTLVTLLLACCFGSAMAQSNLPPCAGPVFSWQDKPPSWWTDCYAEFTGYGMSYSGEWRDAKRHGKGKDTSQYGSFEGTYSNGRRWTGRGISFGKEIGYVEGDIVKDVNWNNDEIFSGTRSTLKGKEWVVVGSYVAGVLYPVGSAPKTPTHATTQDSSGEAAKQKQAEFEAQRKATELALAEAEAAKRKQAELEAQLAVAQQQAQVKPAAPIAPQGKRVALVIGNAKYKFSPLNNPVNDATDMAASLRSVGFDVIEVKDATLKQMREATRRFADRLEVSDVGLVYYSGHGIEVKGKNYLIPVNADIRREYEVVDQAFDASNLLRMMESLQSNVKKRVNILIVDACRNNDLPKSWRSTNSGLARMDAPAGSFISFATAPGQVASDGQGRNSPYTKHLLNALKQPNVPIEQVFKQVRRNVMDETGGEQVPWENSSLIGDFYFTVAR